MLPMIWKITHNKLLLSSKDSKRSCNTLKLTIIGWRCQTNFGSSTRMFHVFLSRTEGSAPASIPVGHDGEPGVGEHPGKHPTRDLFKDVTRRGGWRDRLTRCAAEATKSVKEVLRYVYRHTWRTLPLPRAHLCPTSNYTGGEVISDYHTHERISPS